MREKLDTAHAELKAHREARTCIDAQIAECELEVEYLTLLYNRVRRSRWPSPIREYEQRKKMMMRENSQQQEQQDAQAGQAEEIGIGRVARRLAADKPEPASKKPRA